MCCSYSGSCVTHKCISRYALQGGWGRVSFSMLCNCTARAHDLVGPHLYSPLPASYPLLYPPCSSAPEEALARYSTFFITRICPTISTHNSHATHYWHHKPHLSYYNPHINYSAKSPVHAPIYTFIYII